MASTRTSGAVNNRMRKFTDPTVNFARIDNSLFVYSIELVNCSVIEPFAVQLGFDLDTTSTGFQGRVQPAG
jgi:hypothetical protein